MPGLKKLFNNMTTKILIELVPKTCWFTNVRSQVRKKDWDFLRKQAYAKYEHKCAICKRKTRLEAHEIWHYNDKEKIQKLFDIVAVCNSCHQLYHIGFSSIIGNFDKSLGWLSKINGWSKQQSKEYIDIVFEIWHQRSRHKWNLDLSFLDNLNIKYENISKEDRVESLKTKI